MHRQEVLFVGIATFAASFSLLLESGPRAETAPDAAAKTRRSRRAPWPARRRANVRVLGLEERLGPVDDSWRQLGPQRDPPISQAELRELGLRPKGLGLVDLGSWPAEPASPTDLRASKLGDAMTLLCDLSVGAEKRRRYARWILRYAGQFQLDPLLLAAVIAQQSRCRAYKRIGYGLGLGLLNPRMYGRSIRSKHYVYGVRVGRRWESRRLPLDRFRFSRDNLLRAEPNIYFTAAFLSVFRRQCPAIDRAFRSAPHRHFVSHFVWGDRVVDAGPEDRILLTRRRLLEYYQGKPREPGRGKLGPLKLDCPLDGSPRKVTGVIGDAREAGRRRHTGIDLDSTQGEPVRAIADGTILLAGVDWGGDRLGNLAPNLTRMVPGRRMGPRGLLIKIKHQRGLVSIYMHLAAYTVWPGQYVTRGQLIGYVGRSGIKESPPHLHFEMWKKGVLLDPMTPLEPYLFSPAQSYRGRRMAALQQRRRVQGRETSRRRGRTPPEISPSPAPSVP